MFQYLKTLIVVFKIDRRFKLVQKVLKGMLYK